MVRKAVGGVIGFGMTCERLAIAVAHSDTPLPPSLIKFITIAAIAGFLVMFHGMKYPRRYPA